MPTRNQRKEAILAGLKAGILKSRDQEDHGSTWVEDQGGEVLGVDGSLYLETVTESILASLERQEEALREEAIAAIKALGRSFGQFQTIPPSPLADQAIREHTKQEAMARARAMAGTLYERQPDGQLSPFILDINGKRRDFSPSPSAPAGVTQGAPEETAPPSAPADITKDATDGPASPSAPADASQGVPPLPMLGAFFVDFTGRLRGTPPITQEIFLWDLPIAGVTAERTAEEVTATVEPLGPRMQELIRKFRNREYPFCIGPEPPLKRCAAHSDGDCVHKQCPQLRDGEPTKSGRHCPLDNWKDEEV